jgi:hypothetical protein
MAHMLASQSQLSKRIVALLAQHPANCGCRIPQSSIKDVPERHNIRHTELKKPASAIGRRSVSKTILDHLRVFE